jgi:urea carboxylase
LKIEETAFSYADYAKSLATNKDSIAAFKSTQQAAFEAERQRWKELRLDRVADDAEVSEGPREDIPDGHIGVYSEVPGNVWKLAVGDGDAVESGQTLVVIESMKMEIAIVAPERGIVRVLQVRPGQTLRAGDLVCALEQA